MLVFAIGCGHPRTLQSITVSPASAGLIGSDNLGAIKYTALGNFINPTEQVDISNEVTWTSSAQNFVTIDNTGLVTHSTISCGGTLITATANKGVVGPGTSDVVVTGTALFTVVDPAVQGCPTTLP